MSFLPIIGGAIGGIGSLVGGGKGASAATDAARIQANAAIEAAKLQFQMFQQEQANLQPWMTIGHNAIDFLSGLTGTDVGPVGPGGAMGAIGNPLTAPLTSPIPTQFTGSGVPYGTPNAGAPGGLQFTPQGISSSWQPTMSELAATPGYQFALNQGLQATQNQFASQGLGASGAALKGSANYAEGLASTTYQQQFNNWLAQLQQQYGMFSGGLGQQYGIWQGENALTLQQRQQIYNMLGGIAGSGQNAAVNLGTSGLTAAGQVGNALTGAAAATAGGIVGSTNALTQGFSGAANAIGGGLNNYLLYNALSGGGGGGANASNYLTGDLVASGYMTPASTVPNLYGSGGF